MKGVRSGSFQQTLENAQVRPPAGRREIAHLPGGFGVSREMPALSLPDCGAAGKTLPVSQATFSICERGSFFLSANTYEACTGSLVPHQVPRTPRHTSPEASPL